MRFLKSAIALLALFTPLSLSADEASPPREETARRIAQAAANYRQSKFIDSAFKKQDISTIDICYDLSEMAPYFFDSYNKEPSSEFKDKVTLMLLRKPSSADGLKEDDGSGGPSANGWVPIGMMHFSDYINERVGHEVENQANVEKMRELTTNLKSRLALADQFEKELAKKEAPQVPAMGGSKAASPATGNPPGLGPKVTSQMEPASDGNPDLPLWIGSGLAAAAAIWLVVKKARGRQAEDP